MERRTLNRRTLLESGITLQGALGLSPRLGATAAAQEIAQAPRQARDCGTSRLPPRA